MSDSQCRQPCRLALVIGSVRQNRLGPTVARWFADQAGQRGDLDIDVIDPADHRLPMRMPDFGVRPSPGTAAVVRGLGTRLAAADAFVVVTPEYNHSFPAVLKNVIDWFTEEWQAKPVGFVSYGGASGGLRAVEQLRLVFAELHAVTVRDSVSLHFAWERFDADGRPVEAGGGRTAAKTMLDQLVWWSTALRDARARHPYSG